MPRPYSFDHFQAKKPAQSMLGSEAKAGKAQHKLTPVKSKLAKEHPETLPGAKEIHYGMDHAETVRRLQARRKPRAAATEREPAARKAAPATRRDTTVAKEAMEVGTRAKRTAPAAKKTTRTPTTNTKQGLLSRAISKLAKGSKEVARQAAAAKTARANKKRAEKGTEEKPKKSLLSRRKPGKKS